ncbi:MAG: MBOAT family O-acyltransferase [Bacteroidia bacterium]
MLFNSFIFFIFLGVVLPLFYILPTKSSKNIFLLLISYFFYGYWDWRFCLLLMFTTIIDYIIGIKLEKIKEEKKRKLLLTLSLVTNLGILVFFKYFNFFVDSFEDVCAQFGSKLDYVHLNILLPVGLSFYIFHNISYIVDIYRNKIKATHNFVDFALFVVFFPQLVAGPIGRAAVLLPQLRKKLQPTKLQIQQGVSLIITGLFRKVMIGDTTGRYVDHIFENLHTYKSMEIICGLVLFSIQIYADFSGYTHIARGTSKLFGVELMKNFEQPYLSRNITEFWRRWHISLSSWLRDYLYISLGGNRKGKTRTYINLFITMLLGGLWHGASWNFVIWGALHGVYLAIHKMFTKEDKIQTDKIHHFKWRDIMNIVLTYILVTFTWVFFRSTSWGTTQLFFSKMLHWESSEFSLWFIKTTGIYLLFIFTLDVFEYVSEKHTWVLNIKSKPFRYGILSGMFLLTLVFMFQTKPAPFMYFKF